jgi:Xaa-Pro aminopeptidase
MNLEEIQRQLGRASLDGWLLYDFQGINPLARSITGVTGKMLTRRWFCFVPREGAPVWLVSQIERAQFDGVDGEIRTFNTWGEFTKGLSTLLQGRSRIAMEYSPGGTTPYVGRVDAGTLEIVRDIGVEVVSSADLVQWCEARWSPDALATHLRVAQHLNVVREQAFYMIAQHIRAGRRISEYDIQQEIVRYFTLHGLVAGSAPIVAAAENSSDPHYQPSASSCKVIAEGDVVLVDLWAKLAETNAVYADITWMGYVGEIVPEEIARVFATIVRGRDAAIEFIKQSVAKGETLRGYQVDDVARAVLTHEGYGERFIHRTGHNLGTEDHGTGVNFDNYEMHDERLLIPDIACSIEPGIYLGLFGMRSEVNIYIGERRAEVTTTPVQRQVVPLLRERQ